MCRVTTRLERLQTLSAQLDSDQPERAEADLEALFPMTRDPDIPEVSVYGLKAGVEARMFMTVNQVAEAVALHPKVVRRAIDAGELRAFKLRTRIRIRESDFEAWIDANRVEPYPIPELEP